MDDKIAIRRRVVISVGVIALVLVIDQIIKIAVKTHMWVGERISVTDWFQIFFTENKGMAFGLDFSEPSSWRCFVWWQWLDSVICLQNSSRKKHRMAWWSVGLA